MKRCTSHQQHVTCCVHMMHGRATCTCNHAYRDKRTGRIRWVWTSASSTKQHSNTSLPPLVSTYAVLPFLSLVLIYVRAVSMLRHACNNARTASSSPRLHARISASVSERMAHVRWMRGTSCVCGGGDVRCACVDVTSESGCMSSCIMT